jgi:cytochrome c oxidase subunit 1
MTGKKLSPVLGHLHFWPTLFAMNGIFFPMLIQGFAGVSRRLYDGGATYAHAEPVIGLNTLMAHSAFLLAGVQLFFVINVVWTLAFASRASDNPWESTTLEWAAPSPPLAQGNFASAPTVHRGPYDYSVPGAARDFSPQHEGAAA